MILCVSANPSVDKLFEVDRLVPGGVHRPTGFVQVPGGKGLNVARVVAALGADVHVAAILRGHAGKWIEEGLSAAGVAGSFVWTHGETRASLSIADRERGGLTEFYEHGSEIPSSAWPELANVVADLLTAAGWVTISGSLPPGSPPDGYAELVGDARAAGVPVALDAAGEHLRRALEANPDVVKVNRSEAADVLGVEVDSAEAAMVAAQELRRLSGGDAHAGIVTRGADGVAVAAPDGTTWEGRLYVRGPYPVGSGDSFLAGLVVGLAADADWPGALRLALGAAAANAELPGAGRVDPARVRSLADGALVEPSG